MAEYVIAGVAIAAAIGGSVYASDQSRRQQNQAIDAAKERQRELLKAEEEARRRAEAQRKTAEQEVEIGKLDIGEEDEAAMKRSRARGKTQFIIEQEAQNQPQEERLQIGTTTPERGTTGVQV